MSIIRNQETLRQLRDATNLDLGTEKPVEKCADQIVPTIETNPKLTASPRIVKYSVATNASNIVFHTSKDAYFYLTGFTFSRSKNAASDNSDDFLKAYVGGTNSVIAVIAGITLTADSQTINAELTHPIRIDKDTDITTVSTAASVGTSRVSIAIRGFESP